MPESEESDDGLNGTPLSASGKAPSSLAARCFLYDHAQESVKSKEEPNSDWEHPAPQCFVKVCIQADTHACTHVCMYACICMYTCMHACMYARMHVRMRACTHVYMNACMHACMHACIRACVRVCVPVCAVCACLFARWTICMCVHVYMLVCAHAHDRLYTRVNCVFSHMHRCMQDCMACSGLSLQGRGAV